MIPCTQALVKCHLQNMSNYDSILSSEMDELNFYSDCLVKMLVAKAKDSFTVLFFEEKTLTKIN